MTVGMTKGDRCEVLVVASEMMIDGQCEVIVVTLMTDVMDIMTLKLLVGIIKVKEVMVSVRSGIIYAMLLIYRQVADDL